MERMCLLDIDGRPQDISVGVASRWWSRTRGLWPGDRWPAFDVLQIPRATAYRLWKCARVWLQVKVRNLSE